MKTPEQIRKEYETRIKATEDETEKAKLQAELYKELYELESSARSEAQLESWRREALSEFPMALPEQVVGATQEEVKTAAKASHERIEGIIASRVEAEAKKLEEKYGTAAWGGQTASGTDRKLDSDQAKADFIDSVWKGLREQTATKPEVNRMIETRIGDRMNEVIASMGGARPGANKA